MMGKDLRELLLAFNERGVEYLVPPQRIDILQSIDGVTFEDAWQDRTEALIEGELPAQVISRKHLIQNKLMSSRTRDLADVEAIRDANPEGAAE